MLRPMRTMLTSDRSSHGIKNDLELHASFMDLAFVTQAPHFSHGIVQRRAGLWGRE